MSNLAIIPARGGSKRIPRKNIKYFLGKPIIGYSIEVALKSQLFDEVMVSTDDDEISEIAKGFGAKVPFRRSAKNADDYAGTIDVIHEVLGDYKSLLGREFNFACCMYPAAPLVTSEHLIAGFELIVKNKYDTVFPVVPFSSPIWRGLEIDEQGKTKMIWPEYLKSRSQDLKPVYHDAGQWYWIKADDANMTLFTSNTASLMLSEEEAQDIDTFSDWKIAEMKYNMLHNLT